VRWNRSTAPSTGTCTGTGTACVLQAQQQLPIYGGRYWYVQRYSSSYRVTHHNIELFIITYLQFATGTCTLQNARMMDSTTTAVYKYKLNWGNNNKHLLLHVLYVQMPILDCTPNNHVQPFREASGASSFTPCLKHHHCRVARRATTCQRQTP
jgi:hypothetical protein